ncbi:hypothetical protein [Secundilactobacillus malefermentans]|uniref:hypothetical protein n=1 Tax=Secundilactobacillus malefermentans TaxID=176292 RepID=UPI0011CA65CC|nr:hypothetical protein [Secundilactobacillus malefermentans]QEA31608.1 hypothetical protein FGL90_05115 [Secundilactobacillus malefermentans]
MINKTKHLLLGISAMALAATISSTLPASISAATITTDYTALKTSGTKRNVQSTGENALYTKPGTTRGAKIIISKAKMKAFNKSNSSKKYFRAYGYEKTNTGQIYYRVVSMDSKYRGYVYGGKQLNKFAGGVVSAQTTQSVALPKNTTVYFNSIRSKTYGIWSAPQYTQYKSKNILSNVDPRKTAGKPYTADQLTITKAVKKTREGSVYYYIKDARHPSINGWIYSGAVSNELDSNYYSGNSVALAYKVVSTGNIISYKTAGPYYDVSSISYDTLKAAATSSGALPNGYSFVSLKNGNKTLTNSNTIHMGNSITVMIEPNKAS